MPEPLPTKPGLILMLSQVSFVGREQSDTDRIEPIQSIEILRFSAREHRGIMARWDFPLLTSTPPLDNSTVDANDAARARCSVREERAHNGCWQPGVE